MAKPEIDREEAIRVLLDAAVSGDRTAAKRAGIDERTLRRWRVRLASDPQLSAAFRAKNEAADRSWKAARRETLGKLIRAIAAKIEDPETTMSELTGAAKVLGELEITQEALGSSATNQPGESTGEAEDGSGAAGPAGTGRSLH